MKNKTWDKDILKYGTGEKDFDCVKMMRDIRTNLFNRYRKDPSLMKKEMNEIKKKFGF
jgi:hypothetical protein